MANIIPVSGMLNPIPDFNRTWREGVQFGQQQRQQSEARQREQQVRNLAPQIVAGDPAAYSQAAAIDPQAAGAFQDAGDSTLRRFKGFVSYIDGAREQAKQTGDWRHVDAALQQANPWLTQILGKPGPTAWPQGDPQWEAGWEGLKARLAGVEQSGSGSNILSTYVDDQGNRVAVRRDGTTQVLGGADAGMSQQTINVTGPDGRPAQYTFDKRTGNYVPAQLGGAPQGPVQAPAGVYIDPSLPPEVQQQIAQAEAAGQQPPSQMYFGGGQQPASPFVGQSPAEKAASERAAQHQVDLAYSGARGTADAQAAAQRETAVQTAKNRAEKEAGRGKAKLALDQATSRVQRVDTLVDSILPRVGYATAGLASLTSAVPGTPAGDLKRDIGTLQAIAGFDELNAMRASSPTGGALGNVTERELAFLQSVVRNIENSQSPEQLRRNLEEFRREVKGSWERVQRAYQQDYGDGLPPMLDYNNGGNVDAEARGGVLRYNPATGNFE